MATTDRRTRNYDPVFRDVRACDARTLSAAGCGTLEGTRAVRSFAGKKRISPGPWASIRIVEKLRLRGRKNNRSERSQGFRADSIPRLIPVNGLASERTTRGNAGRRPTTEPWGGAANLCPNLSGDRSLSRFTRRMLLEIFNLSPALASKPHFHSPPTENRDNSCHPPGRPLRSFHATRYISNLKGI